MTDGSSETLFPQVTGVVTAFPSLIFPANTTTTITQSRRPLPGLTPGALPAGYYDYSLYLYSGPPGYDRVWSPQDNSDGGMQSTQLSIPYNADDSASQSTLRLRELLLGGHRELTASATQGFGNRQFTPQAGGPVISGFDITSGSGGAGSGVTINGSGFTGVTAVKFGGVVAFLRLRQ